MSKKDNKDALAYPNGRKMKNTALLVLHFVFNLQNIERVVRMSCN